MKKVFLILLFIGMILISKPVYADSWIDEGNYNPDWQSKCGSIFCNFTDEKDLAGIMKSYDENRYIQFGEIQYSKSNLDFSIHDIPTSCINRLSVRFAYSGMHIKVKYGQMFQVASAGSHEIEYVYQTILPSTSNGTITILENPTGLRGDKVRLKVTPNTGYEYTTLQYRTTTGTTALLFDAVPLGNDIYEIPYPSVDDTSNYNIYPTVSFRGITYDIVQNLDLGVSCNNCTSAGYGEHKVIEYNVSEDFEITSVTVDGVSRQLVNNKLELDVTGNVVVEIHTLKRMRSSVIKQGKLNFTISINKIGTDGRYLPGVQFNLRNVDNNFHVKSFSGADSLERSRYWIVYPEVAGGRETRIKRTSGNPIVSPGFLEVYQILPSSIRQALDQFSVYSDLSSLEALDYNHDPAEVLITGNYIVSGEFMIPFILEEVIVPNGYSKKNFIAYALVDVWLEFYADENQPLSGESPLVSMTIQSDSNTFMFFPYDESILDKSFLEIFQQYEYYSYCGYEDTPHPGDHFPSLGGTVDSSCTLTVINVSGVPALSIQNFVNHKNSIVVSQNDPLQYQIVVKNIGNANSTSNVIVTKLPKEIEYISNSASENGVYDASSHSITWGLDTLAEAEEHTFTYQGKIKEGAKPGVVFVGSSEIQSNEVDVVQSGETQVQIQILNPSTFRNLLVVFLVFITLVGITGVVYSKKTN